MNPVPHLFPCMKSVAVGAEQTKVSGIRFPISEPVTPNASSPLVSKFHRWVNVVNVKDSMIGLSAGYALTAKRINQLQFALPVSRVLMFCKSVFVPVISAASVSAKSIFTRFAALLARLIFPPSSRKVAVLTAKLASPILNPIGVYLKFPRAMFTDFRYLSFCAHGLSPNRDAHYSTKYFDIACKRIDQAYAQGDLFVPKAAPKQTQESLI